MAHYNFDEILNRKSWGSIKWDNFHMKLPKNLTRSLDDIIPLWVADMDFKAPQVLIDAMIKMATHGIYGYHHIPNDLKGHVKHWLKKIHNWDIDADKIAFSNGVVPSIIANIFACSSEGDEILYMSPIYGPMISAIKDFGRIPVNYNINMEGDEFQIDFDLLESKISPRTKLFVLCNPHNPGGRVWRKDELERIAHLCITYNLIIISNEIHSDLVYSEYTHIPIASLSNEIAQICVTHLSLSKTFNLGGQKLSHFYSDNESLYKRVSERNHAIQGSMPYTCFGVESMKILYTQASDWYRELLHYLEQNKDLSYNFISEHTAIRPIKPQGTYLMWLDCRKISTDEEKLKEFFVNDAGILLNEGSYFGEGGKGYMRLNFACPRPLLLEALDRLKNACYTFDQ